MSHQLRVKIVGSRTETPVKGKPFTVYLIEVVTSSERFTVSRRYNQFGDFKNEVEAKYPATKNARKVFPGKTFFRSNMSPEVIQERKEAFEVYINQIISAAPDLISSAEFLHFVCDEPGKRLVPSPPTEAKTAVTPVSQTVAAYEKNQQETGAKATLTITTTTTTTTTPAKPTVQSNTAKATAPAPQASAFKSPSAPSIATFNAQPNANKTTVQPSYAAQYGTTTKATPTPTAASVTPKLAAGLGKTPAPSAVSGPAGTTGMSSAVSAISVFADKRKEEEDRKRGQEKRIEEERELERKRVEEEQRRKREDELRRKREEEDRRHKEEEDKRKREEDRRKREEEDRRKRDEEERRKKVEQESQRKREQEVMQRKKEEEDKRKREEERRKKDDDERRKREDDERRKREEEKRSISSPVMPKLTATNQAASITPSTQPLTSPTAAGTSTKVNGGSQVANPALAKVAAGNRLSRSSSVPVHKPTHETLAAVATPSVGRKGEPLPKPDQPLGLVEWCKYRTQHYPEANVKDFTKSWLDGYAFCAILHSLYPNRIDYDGLAKKSASDRLKAAFALALEMGVPDWMDPEDLGIDRNSTMTYVAEVYNRLDGGKDSIKSTLKK